MKQKRANKTKEQLQFEMYHQQEVARKRKIVVEQFYPALLKATISVDEAKMLIQGATSFLMEEVLGWMQREKFADMMPKVIERLCPDGERKDEITALLKTVEGENVFVAREIIEGMSRAIEQMIHDDLKKKKLDELTPDWDRYLH